MWKYDWHCLLQMQLMIQRNWIASINGLAVDSTLQSASKEERERKPCLSMGGDKGLIPKILLGSWSNLWTWCLKLLNHCCWPTAQSDSAPSPSMFKLKRTTTTGGHQNAAEGQPEPGMGGSKITANGDCSYEITQLLIITWLVILLRGSKWESREGTN